ncbi:MAG: tRNA pseudouridine(55) synthase TruB [Bacteroidales bacterium]|nr:tRNA pseudouridine(55) synthase TruB [Bacteroidales bacterium]
MIVQNGRKNFDFQKGEILFIDKPLQWTSFDVVNKIRNLISRYTGIRKIKVGHAGTLDPLATGLLILCTGKFTKRIQEFQGLDKEYTGVFFIGATTPSYDRETKTDKEFDISHVNEELLLKTAKDFIGTFNQVPPLYSAVNIEGKRAYKFARNNEDVKLPPKKITIQEFELTEIQIPEVHFRVVCSKGTYIRSLARDFGKALGSGSYLTSLTRIKIGDYDLSKAITIEDFEIILNK